MWDAITRYFAGVAECVRLLNQVVRTQTDHTRILAVLIRKVNHMTQQIDDLDAKQTALEAKIDETNATLGQLAQAVVDLRALIGNTAALEAAVVHAADRAQKMLDKLAAAEDAADNVFETPPGPETPPEPAPPTA